MALINLLPRTKHKKEQTAKKIAAPGKFPIIIPFITTSILILLLCGLSLDAVRKNKLLTSLEIKLKNTSKEKSRIDELNKTASSLESELSFYKDHCERKILWPDTLEAIRNAIPQQIWLTQLSTEKKETPVLIIKGSAVSMVEAEIIDAISEFAEGLKAPIRLKNMLSEIKVGALNAERRGNLNLMNFTLQGKFR